MNIFFKNINVQRKLVRFYKTLDTLQRPRLHCNKEKFSQSRFHTREHNLKYIYQFWKKEFTDLRVSEPKESIENILAHAIGSRKISDVHKNPNLILGNQKVGEINKMCNQRLKNMPVQYIIGEWDFGDLTLKMRPPVFIPRPETENLVELIINDLKTMEGNINVLDICCGSGAISLALLKSCSQIKVTAIDQCKEACRLTKENAGMHQLEDRLTVREVTLTDDNRLREVTDAFNIIVSNPPYVPSPQLNHLEPEITQYEDLKALDGGEDGLSIIKLILYVASEKLLSGGLLYLETDPTHPVMIQDLLERNRKLNLEYMKTYKDFCGKDRFVKIKKACIK